MHSKKIAAALLILGVGAFTCFSFSQLSAKGVFAENIKQNVVYTKIDTSVVSQNNTDLSKTDDEAFKVKSSDLLKKYFDISTETNKSLKYNSGIINEKSLIESEPKEQKLVQDAYENKQISAEEFNKRKDGIEKNYTGLKDTIAKLNHGVIQTTWFDGNNCYIIMFNENTKEAESAIVSLHHNASEVPLTTSEEQLKNTAEDFIKQTKLGDINNPKCIKVYGKHVFYQEENDPTKKAEIAIDLYTGKVSGFEVKAYADMFFNETINENK